MQCVVAEMEACLGVFGDGGLGLGGIGGVGDNMAAQRCGMDCA